MPFTSHPMPIGLLLRVVVFAALVPVFSWGVERGDTQQKLPASSIAVELAQGFQQHVAPFLEHYCADCHAGEEPEAALDISAYSSADVVVQHFAVWDLIRERVQAEEMPPRDAGHEVSDKEREQFLEWIDQLRSDYIARHAGDPGEVLARRLSAAELNYTIRDLTGVDIRPAGQFPIDPSNTAGFDNSGESLVMTPSLLNKYIEAARKVADHLLFLPDGLEFAPHPVVTETDRDKYCVRRIVDFYQAQNTNLEEYLYAAWQLRREDATGDEPIAESQTLAPGASESRPLSPKYLSTLRELLGSVEHNHGPIKRLRDGFRRLDASESAAAKEECATIAAQVRELRSKLRFDFPHLRVAGINRGSQPLVLWRNRQRAAHRMSLNRDVLDELEDFQDLPSDSDSRDEMIAAYELFCRVFPDTFYIDRRGRDYLDPDKNRDNRESDYRLLSAGFHSMMGYFRDDAPLCELLLSEEQNRMLDELWFQLDFVADAPRRQHAGFIWFERAEGRFLVDAEFDDFRSADKGASSEEMIARLRDRYLAKAERLGADGLAIQAMHDHFRNINASIRTVETAEGPAREAHVAMLPALAEKAYRRPLTRQERLDTIGFYHELVQQHGLGHRAAARDVLVSILVSPHFCYRLHPSDHANTEPGNTGVQRRAIGAYQLASRLSYFLWSSMPDADLLRLAAGQQLRDPDVLRAQVARMLRDPKSRGLALEFVGNWLGIRQFETHNSVDRSRFPQFDDALRQAMFEEPIRFAQDVLQQNRSVLDFLYANHTFVNRELADHYGIADELNFNRGGWVRVDDAAKYGRGGILPMSAFLTKNSPGLRTSPVKRGFWVVRQLLGTHIPAPPPNVPDLPEDESKLGDLTLRETLAKHREHASCAGCHDKFDAVGLVFEGYGPIGELRQQDLAGNPVDLRADFPDGSRRLGIAGLQTYLREKRQDDFVDTLCRKLLSYALSRSLILSDEPLIESLKDDLRKADYSFHQLVTSIVSSPQFLYQRAAPAKRRAL